MTATGAKLGKPAKKTAIDRFHDNRQGETRRLETKQKLDHEERMAKIGLKRRKYELRYGSSATPRSVPSVENSPAAFAEPSLMENPPAASMQPASVEENEIKILLLKIKLAELTRDNLTLTSKSLHSTLDSQGLSTPTSTGNSLSTQATTDAAGHTSGYDASGSSGYYTEGYGPLAGATESGWDERLVFTG